MNSHLLFNHFCRATLLCLSAAMFTGPIRPTAAAEITVLSPNGSSFAAGEAIELKIMLPELTNLGSYEIIGMLSGDNGSAGTDFFFETPPATPETPTYVFDSSDNFLANVVSPSRLSISDFTFADPGATTGVDDGLASLSVATATTYSGELTVSIDAPNLILDQPDGNPVSNFGLIQNDTALRGSVTVTIAAVPEPNGMSLVALSALTLGFCRRHGTSNQQKGNVIGPANATVR